MKIGFIGTGLMGNPMAAKLIEAGNDVTVYNRTIEKTVNLEQKGAKVNKSPAEVISSTDIIFLMLSNGKAVSEILSSAKKYSGKLVIQMSTISPDENIKLAGKIRKAGGDYIEAPVLGSILQVKEGKLFVMVGGDKQIFELNLNLLKIFGEPFYIGEVGKASALKLAFNQLIGSLITAFSLSLGIVLKENIPVELFMNILKQSYLFARTFEMKLDNMLTNNFDSTNFPTKHLLKDINYVVKEAKKLEIDTTAVEGVRKILSKTMEMGLSEKDYSSLFKAVVT
jgi:3-hydroxyisobutyrate dehydrogenase